MINPFAPFSKALLDAFVRRGNKYFVRQRFTRGRDHFDEGIKGYFIFTHYADIAHAQHHMMAIGRDPYKYLYEWDNPEHQQKLNTAASQPNSYKVYSAVFIKDWEKLVSSMKEKAKDYIETKIIWRPGRGDNVDIAIYVNYGELYAKLKLRGQEVRVKLEEIENYKTCVTTFF